MPVDRRLVPLAVPFLAHVAKDFAASSPTPGDLSDDIVVVPGTRAARALATRLAATPDDRPAFLPAIITAGELPALLLRLDHTKPLASPMEVRLAILAALRAAPPEIRGALARDGAALRDEPARFALAGDIARVLRELSSFGKTVAEAVQAAIALPGYGGVDRWRALAWLEERAITELSQGGRTHEASALRLAHGHTRTAPRLWVPRRVALVGLADLPPALRALVEATGCEVRAFVQGDPEHAARFDAWGVVEPERWQLAEIPLREDRLWFVGGPRDQAELTARLAVEAGDRAVLVGATDPSDEPTLTASFVARGRTLRVARGRALTSSLPAAALRAARDLLEADSIEALSSFARHPEVDRALGRAEVPFAADRLDRSLSRAPSRAVFEAARRAEPALAAAVEKLLAPLLEPPTSRDRVARYLGSLFGGAPPVSNDARAVSAIVASAQALVDVPARLAAHATAAEHLTLVLAALGDAAIPLSADEAAVELVGFLELPLAEVDVCVVTGVAEGRLPARSAEDPFLPEALRRGLGLADAERAFARDAHALLAVVGGHREAHVIAPRTTASGDSLLVSRLVLAAHADVAATRLLRAYEPAGHEAETGAIAPARSRAGRLVSGFGVPALPPLAARPTKLSVTAFRDYLACPYRFALRHLYRLVQVETDPPELTSSAFGSLLHAVLADFGQSPHKDSADVNVIEAYCVARLEHHLFVSTFGAPTAAAQVQAEQAKARLTSFAHAQAAQRARGFVIDRVEQAVEAVGVFEGITLVGRIDRIDRHPDGRVQLFDYKTHDRAETPEARHRKRGEWIDLQLPLYRHLAKALGYAGPFELGYVSLPREDAVFTTASWSEDELQIADEVAALVVDKVLYDPLPTSPVSPPPPYSGAYAGICREGTLADDEDGDGEGEAESAEGAGA